MATPEPPPHPSPGSGGGSQKFEVVDAYAHCGLRKYKPIEDVRAVMAAAGIDRIVLVQHLGEFDNEYIASVVRDDREHIAGVCLVDEAQSSAREELARLVASGDFAGVRMTDDVVRAAPELARAAVDFGLIIVYYARSGAAHGQADLEALLAARPDARIVITHLGMPEVGDAPAFEAQQPMLALARYPGVYFQVSGMHMRAPYPHAPFYPLLSMACEAFGGERLIWGSNYPPVGDARAVGADLHLLLDGQLPFPSDALPAIAGGNARRLYWGS